MPALAITDRNGMYGAIDFYKAAMSGGVKPIFGVDADCTIAGIECRLIFLAENMDGYRNLLKLVSAMHMENEVGSARIKAEHVAQYGADIIVLIPDSVLIIPNVAELVDVLLKAHGTKNVYARLGWNGGKDRQQRIAGIARGLKLPLVATDDTHYLKPADARAYDIVRKIANSSTPSDTEDRTFHSPQKLEEKYRDYPDAINNNEEIVARCTVELTLGNWILPTFEIPSNTSYEAELRKAAIAGIPHRGLTETPEIIERLDYELGIINQKSFAPYFLTVADLLAYARSAHILTTTRGSAAGSLTSYLTGITNVNPLEYNLPFERFLNPGRPKAPDIDMDIADNKRDAMIDYVRTKYGAHRVAQIGTFGTMAARAAVRDVARAMGFPYSLGDHIAKLIPIGSQGFPMTIEHALEIEEDLKKLYKTDEDAEVIINTAREIEGNARHISVHAAGVVIAPTTLTDYTPTQPDPHGEGRTITQYDMYSLSDEYGGVGLLKFDFLGLKNLAVLADSVERVETRRHEKVDIENVAVTDAPTFEMLAKGYTEGVFQLSGGGMTRYLKDLKPTSIHDINAMVALYRPGPMESIPQYIANKENPALITYLDPRMKGILERSYGIITYQDDVLMTAITLAGYTWLEADNLRKAMGKKIPAEMEAQKEKFINGAQSYGKITRDRAEAIWKLIEPFAAYGFNKAHASSYGKVAYQTAYMKAHYSEDYMAALMAADSGKVESIAEHVAECERMGIKVLPPDVNESAESYTVVGDKTIRFGLSSIKNMGEGAAKLIIEERTKNGPYKTLGDMVTRTHMRTVNKKGWEAMIKCGAFDRFGGRNSMLSVVETFSQLQESDKVDASKNQGALFAVVSKTPEILLPPDTTTLAEKLSWEKELLGIYVSGHPTDTYKEVFDKYKGSILAAINEERAGYPVAIGGLVDMVKPLITKKGDRMAFVTISDKYAAIEGVIFPRDYATYKDALTVGSCVLAKGKISRRHGIPSILIDKVKKVG